MPTDGPLPDHREATLAFPVVDGDVLLIRKKRGVGEGYYNGPGGKLEPGETPREAAVREVREEVGATPRGVEKAGELDFRFDGEPFMYVHVFRASGLDGTVEETPEAAPAWFPVEAVPYDRMWPDDRHWLPLVFEGTSFRGWFDLEEATGSLLD